MRRLTRYALRILEHEAAWAERHRISRQRDILFRQGDYAKATTLEREGFLRYQSALQALNQARGDYEEAMRRGDDEA